MPSETSSPVGVSGTPRSLNLRPSTSLRAFEGWGVVRYAPFDVRRCRGDAFVFDRVEERKVTRWMAEVDGAEPASGVCFATPAAQKWASMFFFWVLP